MSEPNVSPASLVLLERIAGAIRDELGAAIDAYPGCRSPEGADPINRAFRAVTRTLARADLAHGTDLDGIVSRALRQLTQRRLKAESWDDDQVKTLVEDEPGSPDDWLVFLLLSVRDQIEPLLDPDDD
jgi:hypothetical protein